MSNPAIELANLLDEWNLASNHTSVTIRGGAREGDSAFWAGQGRAINLIQELEVIASGLEETDDDTEMLRWCIEESYKAVFYVRGDFFGKVQFVFNPDLSRNLRFAGALIRQTSTQASLAIASSEEIRKHLTAAKDLLISIDSLPVGIRTYAIGLVREAIAAIEDASAGGEVRARRLSAQLSTEMIASVDHVPVEKKKSWLGVAIRLITIPGSAFLGALGSAPGNAIVQAAIEGSS